ncbi:tonB-dependent Receptor Plug domain protein, partial [Vibrio parahaemolyticus V-223/04]
SARRVKTNLAK